MDGSIAAIFFLVSLTDMVLNHCDTGCLTRYEAGRSLSVNTGGVIFDQDLIGEEIFLRHNFGHSYGPFQPALGFSATSDGDVWLGYGAVYTHSFGRNFFELSFMPGIYAVGEGQDLGHIVEFRSGLGFGHEFKNGVTMMLGWDHRSNGELATFNPGLETLHLSFSIPLD